MNSSVNENADSKKGINRELRIGATIALFAVQVILIILLTYESVHRINFMTEKNHTLVNVDIICMVIASIFSLSIMRSRRDTVNMYAFLLLIFFDTLHLASDGLFRALNGDADHWLWIGIAENLYLICPILMIITYWGLLDIWAEKGRRKFAGSNKFIMAIDRKSVV